MNDPFAQTAWPQLDLVMRGIMRVEAEKGGGKRERLPISPCPLRKMKDVWSPQSNEHDTKMISAACCLCFFAFLRAGEMTVPSNGAYDASVHLSIQDIAVNNSINPSVICIRKK